ncbi:hypothetical protein V8D89_005215 [Ganoderma adspersum]
MVGFRLSNATLATGRPPIPQAYAWAAAYPATDDRPLLDMSQGVPGVPPPQVFLDALGKAASSPGSCGYLPNTGEPALREAMVQEMKVRYGSDADITQDDIAITAGCNLAFVAVAATLVDSGDEVIIPVPWYFNHEMTLTMLGAKPVSLHTSAKEGFLPSAERCAALITPKTKAIVLVTPNNPTGAIYPPSLIAAFAKLARQNNIALVLDETYRDFITTGVPHRLFSTSESASRVPDSDRDLPAAWDWRTTFVHLFSFSKSYCIPGHRLGLICTSPDIIPSLNKVLDNMQICAPRPPQAALAPLVPALRPFVRETAAAVAHRHTLFRGHLPPRWTIGSQGGYYAFVRHPFAGVHANEVCRRLAQEVGVVTLPAGFFGPKAEENAAVREEDRWIRFSVANVDDRKVELLKNMIQTGLIPNAHNDLVTDASYDFYGLHLATCSLDQRVKVWQLDESTGSWSLEHDWKAHDAVVSKLSWAHPEFGTILATASFDRTVKVWEQISAPDVDGGQLNGTGAGGLSSTRWVERAMLVDAKGTVRSVEFAPQHFGLKLATISSDNYLRIYECLEQPSLSTWQLLDEVDVLSLPIATPSSRSTAHTVTVATPTQTSATLDGNSVSLVSNALQQAQQGQVPGRPGLGTREADGGWSLSWCKDRYWGEILAAGCGIDGIVKIIQMSPSHRPTTVLSLNPSPSAAAAEATKTTATSTSSTDGEPPKAFAITSVAWAPSCGRSYHLVATGSRDGHVRIWRVKPPTPSEDLDGEDAAEGAEKEKEKWSASVVGDFDDHKSAVGRVEWNITGTILSSAGNDGRVRLWKMTAGNVWRPAGHISVEQAEEQQGEMDAEMAVED